MLDSPEGSQKTEQDDITLAQAYAKGMVANEGAGKNPEAKEIISRPTGDQHNQCVMSY